MELCSSSIKKTSIISGIKNPQKILYISGNRNPKKLLIYHKM